MTSASELLKIIEKYSSSKGTYVSVEYDKFQVLELIRFYSEYNIPELYSSNLIHTTLIYSKDTEYIQIEPKLIGTEIRIYNPKYEIFGENKDSLVITFDSPELENRHEELLSLGLKHSWDVYNPHITISESIDESFDTTYLPKFPMNTLRVVIEKSETIK